MLIKLITLCYNEQKIIPFFLNHYLRYVSKVVVYDNESTDRSVEIIKSYDNTEVVVNQTNGEISDLRYLEIKNNAWKDDREQYDWVIVVDMDEFLYHPNFLDELQIYQNNNVTLVPSIGYNMMGDKFPENYNGQIFDKVRVGVHAPNYGKTCIFNPKKIQEINYTPGAHLCRPEGEVILGYPTIKLLHYKYFGYEEWKARNNMYAARLGEVRDGYADAYLTWQNEIKSETDYKDRFEYKNRKYII